MWRFSAAVAPVSKSGHLAAASLDMLLSLPPASFFVSLSSCSHSSMQLGCSCTVLDQLLPVYHQHAFSFRCLQIKKKQEKHATCQKVETQLALLSLAPLGSSLISLSSEDTSDASALTSLLNSTPSTWRHTTHSSAAPPYRSAARWR